MVYPPWVEPSTVTVEPAGMFPILLLSSSGSDLMLTVYVIAFSAISDTVSAVSIMALVSTGSISTDPLVVADATAVAVAVAVVTVSPVRAIDALAATD